MPLADLLNGAVLNCDIRYVGFTRFVREDYCLISDRLILSLILRYCLVLLASLVDNDDSLSLAAWAAIVCLVITTPVEVVVKVAKVIVVKVIIDVIINLVARLDIRAFVAGLEIRAFVAVFQLLLDH